MDRADIHVERVVLHRRGGERSHRATRAASSSASATVTRRRPLPVGQRLIQFRHLLLRSARNSTDRWRINGTVGETIRRRFEKCPRQPGQQSHVGRPVIRRPQRGGAAGGVVAGGFLGLHQRDAAMLGQERGDRGARHPGADHHDIEHLLHLASLSPAAG